MKTFDQLKSKYRVCEIDNRFYVQEKTILGWSYNTRTDYDSNDYPSLPSVLMFLEFVFLALFVLSIGVAIFKKELNNGLIFMPIFCVIIFSIFLLYTIKSKKLSICKFLLRNAEMEIDSLVYEKLNKQKSLEKKYHYFYSQQQLRKEKLIKLK